MSDEIWRAAPLGMDSSSGARNRASASGRRRGYFWSTPRSAAFFAAIIVAALVLAKLLAPMIDLRPG